MHNINNPKKIFKMEYKNNYCEVVEHYIDNPNLFYDPYLMKDLKYISNWILKWIIKILQGATKVS